MIGNAIKTSNPDWKCARIKPTITLFLGGNIVHKRRLTYHTSFKLKKSPQLDRVQVVLCCRGGDPHFARPRERRFGAVERLANQMRFDGHLFGVESGWGALFDADHFYFVDRIAESAFNGLDERSQKAVFSLEVIPIRLKHHNCKEISTLN